MESLIAAENTFQLLAVVLGLTAFGFWAETTRVGGAVSGALMVMLLGMVFSNVGLIPHSAGAYDLVNNLLVPLAVPMLLFSADLKKVLLEIGPMIKAFAASALVISIGVVLISVLFDFGEFEAQVAGALSASYIGGSLNFVATAQAVELTEPSHYVGALTADAVGAIFYLTLLMLMPAMALVRKAMPSRYITPQGKNLGSEALLHQSEAAPPFDLIGFSFAIASSMAVCAVSDVLSRMLGLDNYFILVVTVLALLLANLAKSWVRRFSADFEVGTFFMYIFFFVIGAGADLASVAGVALPYVLMICGALVIFFVLIVIVGRLFRLDLAELMIAANACILGPAAAAALAASKGWKDLVTPGMLTGVLGYSVGTFIGVAIANLLS